MEWFWLAIISYFILASVNIVDSFLLKHKVKDERVYAFLIGSIGMFIVCAIPFVDHSTVSFFDIFFDLVAGAAFGFGLILFFRALKDGEPSKVIPFIGGGTPILVALGSFVFLGERFSGSQLYGICFLLAGGVLITLIPEHTRHWWNFFRKRHTFEIGLALSAMALFATFYVITKYTFLTQGFWIPFTYARVGTFLSVAWFLFDSRFRKNLKRFLGSMVKEHNYLFFINQIFGGLGFAGVNVSIALASLTIVNALQGVQYVFVLILASIVTFLRPKLIHEDISRKVIIEKAIAIILIALGLWSVAFV